MALYEGEGSGCRRSWVPLCCPACCAAEQCGRKLQVVHSGTAAARRSTSVAVIEGDRESSRCLTVVQLPYRPRPWPRVYWRLSNSAGIEAAVKLTECVRLEDDEKRKAQN